METLLRAAWAAYAGGTAAAGSILDGLLERYAEPHRRYHAVGHLHRVVADCLELLTTVDVADPAAVVLAACYHDAIYDPRSATNEADSAALADRQLDQLGVPETRRAEVARLVLATAYHQVTDPASAVLLDADLAVLGGPPAAYEAYVRGVRFEYAHLDDATWNSGRAAVLRRLLARPAFYATEAFRDREGRARANLASELSALDG